MTYIWNASIEKTMNKKTQDELKSKIDTGILRTFNFYNYLLLIEKMWLDDFRGMLKISKKGFLYYMKNKKSKEGRESLVKREQFLNKDVNRIFKYHKLTLK